MTQPDQSAALVSAALLDRPGYPEAADYFSPSEDFPDLPFTHRASQANPVYRAVRQCLIDAGLDAAHAGTAEWSPFSAWARPGGRVFVLCNFVYHRLVQESGREFLGKCTHASVIRPVIDYALKAVGPQGSVEFGNAPLQAADWGRLMRETGADRLMEFYNAHAPGRVLARDLRSFVVERSIIGFQGAPEIREGNVVTLDLDGASKLERIAGNREFRVAQYDPRQTMSHHHDGKHVYKLSAKIAAADLIISVPKLKTHEKVGITCALKGCVGAIALKQCLAHHRKGSPARGGDEYPPAGSLKELATGLSDWVWKRDEGIVTNLGRVAERMLMLAIRRTGGVGFGAWPGNDTCWRMALDAARCVAHVTGQGVLEEEFNRPHIVLTDGVIAGEGTGPLRPSPVDSGWISFAADPFAADYVNSLAMGFDPERIPLIREAAKLSKLRVTALSSRDLRIRLNGKDVTVDELRARMPKTFAPPPAWEGTIELKR